MDKDINRRKVVLAEKKRTNKWLAEQLGCASTQYRSGVPMLATAYGDISENSETTRCRTDRVSEERKQCIK